MKTEQFNLRMPKDLMQDLDIISNLLKVNKSEWVKTKLAEEVHKEKNKLLMELSTLYTSGIVSTNQLKMLVGKEIAEEMQSTLQTAKKTVSIGKKYARILKKRTNS
ncbi:hypothetical protein HYT56_04355 [Candidatus Woesearchaeota archaeon]|nr:hypothetical protein [Candidatus Woesearchaeota archaeon]